MLQDLVVLGANSALPLIGRFSSSFVLRASKQYFLIDAGEGCQMKLGQFKVKRSKISHIFISHLHGDHVFGLPGLITSFNLNGRKEKLYVYGPSGIKKYLNAVLEATESVLHFELEVEELVSEKFEEILTIDGIKISSFPLKHRIKTFGYHFEEVHTELNLIPEKIKQYNLTTEEIISAKTGIDIVRDEEMIPFEELTFTKHKPKSFAYCSDTVYDPSLKEYLLGVNVLYHEATYLHELNEQARMRRHSTVKEAASIAKMSEVKKLIIGHYSSRYTDLNLLVTEAKETFQNTDIAEEGKIFSIL